MGKKRRKLDNIESFNFGGVMRSRLALTFIFGTLTMAQTEPGGIKGRISGPAGPVAKAEVESKNLSTTTGSSVDSSTDGSYEIPGLAPGAYQVVVRAAGFSERDEDTTLKPGEKLVLNISLMGDSHGKVAAASLHVVVVAICVMMFVYARFVCGPRARYAAHLASGWGVLGVMYLLAAAFPTLRDELPPGAEATWRVIDSTMSFISSAFLLSSWYLMRDERFEERAGAPNPMPTMSKAFVSVLFITVTGVVSTFIGVIEKVSANPLLLYLLSALDVTFAAITIIMVGAELAKVRLVQDPGQGPLFVHARAHSLFKVLTLVLFLVWGGLQFGYLWSFKAEAGSTFSYPEGSFYTWLAMLKFLCATSAVVLIVHALPTVHWRHEQLSASTGPAMAAPEA
jgi:hypothetical protein